MTENEIKTDQVSIDEGTAPATDAPACSPDGAADMDAAICDAQVDALVAENRDLNDRYLRAVAELENNRRRSAIDCENTARNRAMSVASNFLPVMDAIEAALTHNPNDDGILAMMRAMQAAFAQIGIVKIDAVGLPLNPQFHNAIQVVDAPADADPRPAPNTIMSQMQTGYMFGDSVLRPSMVVVCK